MSRLTVKSLLGGWTLNVPRQEAIDKLAAYEDVEGHERLLIFPYKQYTTIYYILDKRVYIGWYLAQVGKTTHLILQDRHEMGICWVTDGMWFITQDEAEKALEVQNAICN